MGKIKVGIMGGTFDPIHNGHLIISERATEEFGLSKIIFIPTGRPPHKEVGKMSSGEDRYRMTQLAIEGNIKYEISDIEVKEKNTSYTIDTLETIKKNNENYDIYFILGRDSFVNLKKWKGYRDILMNYKLIIANRFIGEDKEYEDTLKEFIESYPEAIYTLNSPIIDISSTDIRRISGENKSIRYMVPEKVNSYILENKLYQ